MTSTHNLDADVKDLMFINNIKSMAVIGPSKKRNFFFLKNHQESFRGELSRFFRKIQKSHRGDIRKKKRKGNSKKEPPKIEWFIWRIVLSKIATLEEIERSWTLSDLMDAHEALDYKEETELEEIEEMKRSK